MVERLTLEQDEQAVFMSPPPQLDAAQARDLVQAHWGLQATVSALQSERDANFQVQTDTASFVLKISNTAEPQNRVAVNTALLEHLASCDLFFKVPNIVKTLEGETSVEAAFDGRGACTVRLLTYLEGDLLKSTAYTQRPFASLGSALGELGRATASFHHKEKVYDILWNSAKVDGLSGLIEHCQTREQRRYFETQLRDFSDHVASKLTSLPCQMIHNDVNSGNILANAHSISGIFDFGDAVFAPRVNELAVASSYQIYGGCDVCHILRYIATGYVAQYALTELEMMVLLDLIKARFWTTILITQWRAALFPDNRNYILRNNAIAYEGLALLDALDQPALIASLLAIINRTD